MLTTAVLPAAAESDTTTIAGIVEKINPDENTIEIKTERIWNGESWTGVSVTFVTKEYITGTVPDKRIFDLILKGDPVQATFTGNEDILVDWLCIGAVSAGGSTGKYLSYAVGDPKYVISPFFNNFKINYDTFADCSDCSGMVCDSNYADLEVSQGWNEKNYAYDYTITTGERHVFTSPEGCESEFSVTFVSGEASAAKCTSYPASGDNVPKSVFILEVVQKGTVFDMKPTPQITPTEQTTVPTPLPTQSPGLMALTALFGIFAAVILTAKYKK